MLIVPALEYEKQRQQPADWNKVILHREGKFYRTYEWSLWLIKKFVCTEEFQKQRVDDLKGSNPAKLYRSINSMLGVMSHFDAHRLSRELFCVEPFLKHGYFADDMTCYYLHRHQERLRVSESNHACMNCRA